jgi:hypothetical protein
LARDDRDRLRGRQCGTSAKQRAGGRLLHGIQHFRLFMLDAIREVLDEGLPEIVVNPSWFFTPALTGMVGIGKACEPYISYP